MKEKLEKINDYKWLLPKTVRKEMNVDAVIFASEKIIEGADDKAFEQLTNVACLPGIVGPVAAMPDIHWGYGLPIGAVGAFDAEEGVISAGLVGFDINCGVRLINTNLPRDQVEEKLGVLIDKLFKSVPCGVGSTSRLKLTDAEFEEVMLHGADWAVDNGYGTTEDLKRMEENGRMEGAVPQKVSKHAISRGRKQLGTLGAGNHFLEVQEVGEVIDERIAKNYGLTEGNTAVMLHCGSRGFGHQIATDYLVELEKAARKYKIWLPDKQLVCAPATSKEGQDYYDAMRAGVNFAFANRTVMMHWIRETFEEVFKQDWESMDMNLVYDVCHNICKLEKHKNKEYYVHRKGATRAFAPGHSEVPELYRESGQPVLIAGTMGTASYVLAGTEGSMQESWGTSCHGAGRAMSRHQAIKTHWGEQVKKDLAAKGIIVKATHPKILSEEAPDAYKDVDEVVKSVEGAGISRIVAKMLPMGVAKG